MLAPGEARVYQDATIPDPPPPATAAAATPVPEDPDREFPFVAGERPRVDGPRVINVGVPGPGVKAALWRRAWRDKVRSILLLDCVSAAPLPGSTGLFQDTPALAVLPARSCAARAHLSVCRGSGRVHRQRAVPPAQRHRKK